MERGMLRFTSAVAFAVAFGVAGVGLNAQTAGTIDGVSQLTAAMLGQVDGEPASIGETTYAKDDPSDYGPIEQVLKNVQARGYINVGYAYNFNNNQSSFPGGSPAETVGRVFDTYHNEFVLHQVGLYLTSEASNETPVGFSFGALLGKDAAVTANPTFVSGGDIDILEANIQVYTPDSIGVLGGTVFTLGKFLTSAGNEVIDSAYNDNVSRSIMSGALVPFTHVGLKADTTIIEREDGEAMLSLMLGIANGWGNQNTGSAVTAPRGNGGFPTWLTSATFSPGGALDPSLTVNWFVGETSRVGRYRNLLDLVASLQLFEGLSTSANFDYVTDEAGFVGGATGPFASAWSFSWIVRFDISDAMYIAGRWEHFEDTDGAFTGTAHSHIDPLTATVGWWAFPNLLLRAELRVDPSNRKFYGNGTDYTQTTLGFDASLVF